MKLNKKHILLFVSLIIVVFMLMYNKKEGFQGSKVLRNSDLQPVVPFVPRKDSTYGSSYKGVPLVIYHSWGTNTVPPKMYENIQALIEKNPEFDYSFNTDEDCREFIKANFDEAVVKAFDCLKPGAYKSDLWRYCILFKKGGAYIDIKCMPKKKLIHMMDKYELPLFVLDSPKEFVYSCSWNGFMISAPGNPIFRKCIDEVVKNVKAKSYEGGSLSITGPCLLGKVIQEMSPDYKYKLRDSYQKTLDEHGEIILAQYPEYRQEQRAFQKGKHYGEYFRMRQVYAC
jgi:mannosyltransferase OCH1-like enzyme